MLSRPDYQNAIEKGLLVFERAPSIEDASINLELIEVWAQQGKRKKIEADGKWHFRPGEYYIGYLEPRLTSSAHFRGHVFSRSSYARLGLFVSSQTSNLDNFLGVRGQLRVGLRIDTYLSITPGELPAQLVLHSMDETVCLNHTPLTLHDKILIYDGRTELYFDDPTATKEAFREIELPARGLFF